MLWFFALWACEFADLDTGEPIDEPPDVTGVYVVETQGLEGCEAEGVDLSTWMAGDLVVQGPPDALVLDFGEGRQLDGVVDTAFSLQVSGVVDDGGWSLLFEGDGVVYRDGAEPNRRWVLDVAFAADAEAAGDTATPSCRVTGAFVAEEQVGQ